MTPIESLRKVLPEDRVLDGAEDLLHYGSDWSRHQKPAPMAVALPQSEAEVQALVRWAVLERQSLVPSGGRTGLSGGAVAANGEVVLSLERMRGILEFDSVDRTLKVQAGASTQSVQEAARAHGLFYPVDLGSRGSCQIGGNIATNAGGLRVLRYGMTRNWVVGLRVVTGTGELLDLNRGLVKNATGYDFRHLIVGSEGTLAICVGATLQLTDPPPPQRVMLLGMSSLEGVMVVFERLRRCLTLSAFEFFCEAALKYVIAAGGRRPFRDNPPFMLLAEFDDDESTALDLFDTCLAEGSVIDGVLSQSPRDAGEMWKLREGITESIASFKPYKNDVAVRVSQVPEFVAAVESLLGRSYPNYEIVWFGHIGDGNLHINIVRPLGTNDSAFQVTCESISLDLASIVSRFEGSISAEHGVGLLKKPYLLGSRAPAEVELMRHIKRVFDPYGILNPGKIFDAS